MRTIHVRGYPANLLQQLTGRLAVDDGDCGNTWGETRAEHCPNHLQLTYQNDDQYEAVAVMERVGLDFCVTDQTVWSKDVYGEHWGPDSDCPHVAPRPPVRARRRAAAPPVVPMPMRPPRWRPAPKQRPGQA